MILIFGRYWWAVLLRGVIALIFGMLALLRTEFTILALVYLFGFYAIFDGILTVASAWTNRTTVPRWWVAFLGGLAGITAGFVIFLLTDLAAVALVYLIAAWALLTGLVEVITAIRLREEIRNEWALGLSGVLKMILAVYLIIQPVAGVAVVVWALGIYAIIFGLLMFYLAFRMRNASRRAEDRFNQMQTERGE